MATSCAAFLQSQKLLRAEGLIVDLARGFNQILEMGASEEVSQVDEFAMVLVLYINEAPAVLPAADMLAIDKDILLAADHGEWNDVLHMGYGRTKTKPGE